MSIRSNILGPYPDLAPQLRDTLRRNGMQAHLVSDGGNLMLAVHGHDSPLLTYPLDAKALAALTDGGTSASDRKAYDTFAGIVSGDFDIPKDHVHARNAGGRVVMGLHGYRVDSPYGYPLHRTSVLAWAPRHAPGYHLRRVGDSLYMPQATMVPERRDGRIRPGELTSGGYGFYYKGNTTVQPVAGSKDVLKELDNMVPVIQARPQNELKTGIPYSETVTSDVYFSDEKWQEVLSSHGIIVDTKAKTLTIQSAAVNRDLVYDLSDEEADLLSSRSVKDVPVQTRLDVINAIIKDDYVSPVTTEMLESRSQIDLALTSSALADISGSERRTYAMELSQPPVTEVLQESWEDQMLREQEDARHGVARVDGRSLYDNGTEAWFREGEHGREVSVGEIRVEPVKDDREADMKYRMTAVINGEAVTHEITQKQYDKFMAVDDYHRMKLFSKVFSEVDMKALPRERDGVSIGAGILAALTVAGGVAHGVMAHRHEPDIFMERHGSGHIYMKPGVDTPQDIASRAFEAGINAAEHGVGLGR